MVSRKTYLKNVYIFIIITFMVKLLAKIVYELGIPVKPEDFEQ